MVELEKKSQSSKADIPNWVQNLVFGLFVLMLFGIFFADSKAERTEVAQNVEVSTKPLITKQRNEDYQQPVTMVFHDATWVQVLSVNNIDIMAESTEFTVIIDQEYQAGDKLSIDESELIKGGHGLILVVSDISASEIYTSLQIKDEQNLVVMESGKASKKIIFEQATELVEASSIYLNNTSLQVLN